MPFQFQLIKKLKAETFRAGSQVLTITNDNINQGLYDLAVQHGKGHCFEKVGELQGQKKSQSKSPLPQSILTLNEVPTVEIDLNKAQENKPDVSVVQLVEKKPQPKKRGRPSAK